METVKVNRSDDALYNIVDGKHGKSAVVHGIAGPVLRADVSSFVSLAIHGKDECEAYVYLTPAQALALANELMRVAQVIR